MVTVKSTSSLSSPPSFSRSPGPSSSSLWPLRSLVPWEHQGCGEEGWRCRGGTGRLYRKDSRVTKQAETGFFMSINNNNKKDDRMTTVDSVAEGQEHQFASMCVHLGPLLCLDASALLDQI